jgi:hypothetical protein
VEVAPEPSAEQGGYPSAGAPFLDCATDCVKPCAFTGEFNLTSKLARSNATVRLRVPLQLQRAVCASVLQLQRAACSSALQRAAARAPVGAVRKRVSRPLWPREPRAGGRRPPSAPWTPCSSR